MTTLPPELLDLLKHASYPPFKDTSANTARELLDGKIDYLVEILSINGHLLMELERVDYNSVVLHLYWTSAPLDREASKEWGLIFSRLSEVLPHMSKNAEITSYSEPWPGWSSAVFRPIDDPYLLSALIGSARSVAGIRPYTGLPHTGVLPLPPSKSDLDNTLMSSLGLDSIIVWLDEPEKLIAELVRNNMFYEVYPPREAADVAGMTTPRYVRSLYRRLEKLGALRVCRERGRHRYFVDMRSEIILSTILFVSEELGLPCALLPLVEGVFYEQWRVYPDPYKRCRNIIEEFLDTGLEWGKPPC